MTLDALLDAHALGKVVDFLKIDAEGAEADILSAATFTVHRPRVLVIEATVPLSQSPAWGEWEPGLLTRGYHFVWFDGLNRFYLRDEDIGGGNFLQHLQTSSTIFSSPSRWKPATHSLIFATS